MTRAALTRSSTDALTLTIEQAACRQTDAAIAAFFSGDYDVALTLAGAAEGMIRHDGPHLFPVLRDHPRVAASGIQRREWIDNLNEERDWLKHGGAPEMTIQRIAAEIMIVRALTKLTTWSDSMNAFKGWVVTAWGDTWPKDDP